MFLTCAEDAVRKELLERQQIVQVSLAQFSGRTLLKERPCYVKPPSLIRLVA